MYINFSLGIAPLGSFAWYPTFREDARLSNVQDWMDKGLGQLSALGQVTKMCPRDYFIGFWAILVHLNFK